MRPVMAGVISYEALRRLDLADIYAINDELDVRDENERRMSAWHKANPDG